MIALARLSLSLAVVFTVVSAAAGGARHDACASAAAAPPDAAPPSASVEVAAGPTTNRSGPSGRPSPSPATTPAPVAPAGATPAPPDRPVAPAPAPAPSATGTAPAAPAPGTPSSAPAAPASAADALDATAAAALAGKGRPPRTLALLINGGDRPAVNYQSHKHHIEDLLVLLRGRGVADADVSVFMADGADAGADLAVRDAHTSEHTWLLEGTGLWGRLRPRTELRNTELPGVVTRPATYAALRAWFENVGAKLRPGDTLFLYVTDHGTANKPNLDNNFISLWGEKLSVLDLEALLGRLQPGVRVVSLMSQCHSGAFANLMYDLGRVLPSGQSCGFFSATADRLAYGCYPEGRDRDRVGHSFQMFEALGRVSTLAEANDEVLVTDRTPDVPHATSDRFLERLVREDAEAQGLELDARVDALLVQAWRERARWEGDLRRLDAVAAAYGMFSPRSLAELGAQTKELAAVTEAIGTYADRWRASLDDVRAENTTRFLEARPALRDRTTEAALGKLDAAGREALRAEVLRELDAFTRKDKSTWRRLEALRKKHEEASGAHYRLEVRNAAVLRLRMRLVSVAGRVLVEQPGREAQRKVLEAMRACEGFDLRPAAATGGVARVDAAVAPGRAASGAATSATPPGGATPGGATASAAAAAAAAAAAGGAGTARAADASAALSGKTAASAATSASDDAPFPPLAEDLAVASRVLPSWLGVRYQPVPENLLQREKVQRGAVVVQVVYPDSPASKAGLQPGDIVLGPPDAPFLEPHHIREWTMLTPQNKPVDVRVQRQGKKLTAEFVLQPFPIEWPSLPGPPAAGTVAPKVGSLVPFRGAKLPELGKEAMVLYFWATWCGPCKRAVPALLAYEKSTGVPVVAVTDEPAETLEAFFAKWDAPFPARVVSDELRRSFIDYGVSGTPTFVLIDAAGNIVARSTGFSEERGLGLDGKAEGDGEVAKPPPARRR